MKKIYKLLCISSLFLSTALGLSSCDDFLDEQPSKSTSVPITTIDQLEALLSSYGSFWEEESNAATFAHDDYGYLTALYDAGPNMVYYLSTGGFFAGLWDYKNLGTIQSDRYWTGEWGKIFIANTVLHYLDKVSGTEVDKARLKAEAHFIRAYSYWGLANTYCLPYVSENKSELGLPLKTGTSFEEPLARASLEETYQFIEVDIQEALKCNVTLMQGGKARHWRANTAGINGFLARYYLCQNDYAKAMQYANTSLSEYNQLVDYNTEMYSHEMEVIINPGTPQEEDVVIEYPYTHKHQSNLTDYFAWKEHLYFRFLSNGMWFYIPTQDLLDLYDTAHDLRYKYHIVEHYSYGKGLIQPAYDYPGYVFFFEDKIPNGPTTSEMYLIKAECQARLGDYNGGMNTLNELRAKRMEPGPWVNLSATSKDNAIKQILEERRREKPFTQRWFDLRRYNNNEDPNDDVEVKRTFYRVSASMIYNTEPPITYTLEKKSRKYALPILQADIQSSNGVIKQNTY